MAIAMAPSATALVPEPGVITTAMPRAVAVSRSTFSTPTPVLAMTWSRGVRLRNSLSSTASARAIAPCACARSASVGFGMNRQCPPRTGNTSSGSTTPRPTTTGRCSESGIADHRLGVSECGTRDLRHLVPLPVDRRGGNSGDDFGVGECFLDGGVPLFPPGNGDQELLGLDDLEVVVAHAVARTGLKGRIVALRGIAQDGGVALAGALTTDGQLELVHLLEVPGRGTFGAVDLEAQPALWADDDPGRLQGADRAGAGGICGEPDDSCGVVVVFDVAQLTVFDDREVRRLPHRKDRPLGVDGGEQPADLADRADDVLHQVHDVAEQVAERAAAG